MQVAASEAKARLAQLLTDVERGQSVVITRHGRRVARLIPERDHRQEEIDRAVANIRALKSRKAAVTAAELISARDEGRRF